MKTLIGLIGLVLILFMGVSLSAVEKPIKPSAQAEVRLTAEEMNQVKIQQLKEQNFNLRVEADYKEHFKKEEEELRASRQALGLTLYHAHGMDPSKYTLSEDGVFTPKPPEGKK